MILQMNEYSTPYAHLLQRSFFRTKGDDFILHANIVIFRRLQLITQWHVAIMKLGLIMESYLGRFMIALGATRFV